MIDNAPIYSKDAKITGPKTFNVKPSLGETKKLVKELMRFIDDNKLAVQIAGKKYIQVEGWQFAGSQLNLTAIVTDIQDVTETGGAKIVPKYKATVEIIHNPTGQLVSRGFALCSKAESKKSGFDEYAVASMAQTRAIGKAYRNILAWLVKMAGYEGTPTEEITEPMRETMTEELSVKKAEVFSRFKELGISDSEIMIDMIRKAISKTTLDTVDDANKVLDHLRDDDEAQ